MDFPREILEELFMRLPVKLLTRFKLVSKDWNSFISDGSFRKRYHSRQKTKCSASTGFICHSRENYSHEERYSLLYKKPDEINFLYTSENYVKMEELKSLNHLNKIGFVVAASKSLLLLCFDPENLCVYDLAFKKGVNLPENPEVGDHISLGFKCEEKPALYHDHNHNHLCYTVVCVDIPHTSIHTASSVYNVKIYSSETGVWRNSIMKANPSNTFRVHPKYVAKVIRGVFHWHEPCYSRIIAYDCDDPEGRAVLIECPTANYDIYSRERLKALEGRKDGSLQFIGVDNVVVSVWILKSTCGQNYMRDNIVDVSRWSLACRVNIQDIGIGVYSYWLIGIGVASYWHIDNFIGADPADADVIYLRSEGKIHAYNYHEQIILFASSQNIPKQASQFIHFEWPVWPCL